MVNKLRAMLGAGPFPESLPPISVRNQKLQRIRQRICIAETRLITRLAAANQALSRFAKAKKKRAGSTNGRVFSSSSRVAPVRNKLRD
jgi:hypothetical protein